MNTSHKNAFGLIETKGFVSAIEAANIMLQTANVTLVGYKQVGAGIFTVIVRGEISSVKEATDAGAAAAANIGKVKAVHVFPRLHTDLEKLLLTGLQNDL